MKKTYEKIRPSKITKRESTILRKLFKMDQPEKTPENKLNQSYSFTNDKNLSFQQIKNLSSESLIKKPIEIKDKILDFNFFKQKKIPSHLKIMYRFANKEAHLSLLDKIQSIIIIQTHYRRYISQKHFIKKTEEMIEKKGLESVIFLQSYLRLFLTNLKVKKNILKNYLKSQRKNAVMKIIKNIYLLFLSNNFKKNLLKKNIKKIRNENIIKIQCNLRRFLYYKKFKEFKNKFQNNYYLIYPFYAKKVEIKIFTTEGLKNSIKLYQFEYSKFLECFILFIDQNDFPSGKYRCQFIVDGSVTCDGRFPHIEFTDGIFYNLVDISLRKGHKMVDVNYNDYDNEEIDENEINVDGNLSDNVFLDGMKNNKEEDEEDEEFIKKELVGRKPFCKLDEIRKISFSNFDINY